MDYNAFNPILIIPSLGALNVCPWISNSSLISEPLTMNILFFVLIVVYVYFIVSVVLQLSNHLKIYVFKIKRPLEPQKKQ